MRVNINGINIAYRDQGSGLPVILVHAFPFNQTMWDPQIAELKGRCRIVAVDLRGFGGSDVPDGPYLMDQMASDVRGLMSVLSIESAVLVGLSMGGYVSLAFYRDYPEAVRGMLLADTRAKADTPEARERRLRSAAKAEQEGSQAVLDEMIPLLLGVETLQTRPDVARLVRSIAETASPQAIAAAQRGMAQRPDSTPLLSAMRCPVLVVVGSEDSLTTPAEAAAMQRAIPGSHLDVIKGAGHMSNLERREEFNAALGRLIDLVELGTAW